MEVEIPNWIDYLVHITLFGEPDKKLLRDFIPLLFVLFCH